MAPLALSLGGNENQKKVYLPKIVSNEIRFGVGLSEFVGAREDAGLEINKNKVSGRALFVIDAENAKIKLSCLPRLEYCFSSTPQIKILK